MFVGECDGELVILPYTLSVGINQAMDVPADDLTVTFAYKEDFPNVRKIYILDDSCTDIETAISERNFIFGGIVDEQILTAEKNNVTVTIYARSLTAVLLDNECEPNKYCNPSVESMLVKHLTPFGILFEGDIPKCRNGEFRIPKGSSHYSAFKRFCSEFLQTVPRIDHKGICHIDEENSEELLFDNKSGISFVYAQVSDKNCKRYSKIHAGKNHGYNITVTDSESINKGIVRERYLSLLDSSTGTLSDADEILAEGKRKSFDVVLKSDKCLLNKIGCKAKVNLPMCEGKSLIVNSVKYKSDKSGEYSRVNLTLE